MGHFLFHKTLKLFKSEGIKNVKILVGVSGGLDSVVLLHILQEISGPQKLKLWGVHIHHGISTDSLTEAYRKKAKDFTIKTCSSLSLPCLSPSPSKKLLKSEAEFREFRHFLFKQFLKEKKADWVALAHNSDDLLETRLLHLIRGCGEEGIKAMQNLSPPLLRPLLCVSKEEIRDYAMQNKLKWLEDPTNSKDQFLRNWLRNKWLPELEKKRPGSRSRLAHSLSSIASLLIQEKNEEFFFSLISDKGLRRDLFNECSLSEQRRALAFYMRKQGLKNYGKSHIEEILKNLERKQKGFSLKLLKKTWKITNKYLYIED